MLLWSIGSFGSLCHIIVIIDEKSNSVIESSEREIESDTIERSADLCVIAYIALR